MHQLLTWYTCPVHYETHSWGQLTASAGEHYLTAAALLRAIS